ncbi:uncharacterized protein [Amphiura filiformis]|uniref:uncharacterized protein n=1 Tax=Amphiura filiformis TaxID=82378 RepID=UPI003B2216A4
MVQATLTAAVFILSPLMSLVVVGGMEEAWETSPISTISDVQNMQVGFEDTQCADHIATTFLDPAGCPHGGEEYRLCASGTRKATHCVNDGMKICIFCDEGYMDQNNNCTVCKPCTHQCKPDEEIETECNAYGDTSCRPKATTSATTVLPTDPTSKPSTPQGTTETQVESTTSSDQTMNPKPSPITPSNDIPRMGSQGFSGSMLDLEFLEVTSTDGSFK